MNGTQKKIIFSLGAFLAVAGVILAVAVKKPSGKMISEKQQESAEDSSDSLKPQSFQELFNDNNGENKEEVAEVKKKYQVDGSALVMPPKKRDGVKIVLGNSKSKEFSPEMTMTRWDGEVELKVKADVSDIPKENQKMSVEGNKIKLETPENDYHFYGHEPDAKYPEGGYEIDAILKEKPAANKIEYFIETEGLDFFYQSALDQETHDDDRIVRCTETDCYDKDNKLLIHRPENVVGSYAIYASEEKINYVGGKDYKTGKVGHIFRPKIIDANGKEVWGELNVDTDKGILSIAVPQKFLDEAVYPVTVDPTFGFDTPGGTPYSIYNGWIDGSLFTSPANVNTAASISFYNYSWNDIYYMKGVIVLHSNLNIITNGVGTAVQITPSYTAQWKTSTFATPPTLSASTDYVLMVMTDDPYGTKSIYYDSGSAAQGHEDQTNNFTTPTNPTDAGPPGAGNQKFSIYCTYTAIPSSPIYIKRGVNFKRSVNMK